MHEIRPLAGGYNAAKVAHKQAMLSGPVPVRILRSAQFHEFVAQIVAGGTQGEVAYVPKMRTQLVAARTVAEALADLVTSPPSVRARIGAGPGELGPPGAAGAPPAPYPLAG